MTQADLTLAIDGGGTGSKARLHAADGSVLAEAEGGPANLQIGDGSAPFMAILEIAGRALAAAGLDADAVPRCRAVLGLAGATDLGCARFFAQNPPFAETRVLADSHAAALGAHGGADGGIVILGTGAVACVVRDGAAREIGGWGFALDDLGSGADIGRRALRTALRQLDGPEGLSAFGSAVLAHFDAEPRGAMDWALTAMPGEFAALAPLIFDLADEGVPEAAAILERSAAEGARLVGLCKAHGAPRIALLGSIAQRLAPRHEALQGDGIVAPAGDALDGAMLALHLGIGTSGREAAQ